MEKRSILARMNTMEWKIRYSPPRFVISGAKKLHGDPERCETSLSRNNHYLGIRPGNDWLGSLFARFTKRCAKLRVGIGNGRIEEKILAKAGC